MKKKFYVTTTIPYANAPPHIGFALEIVQADVLARWNRAVGKDVFFLTGTDEHGSKNYQTAKKQGLSPKEFVDRNSGYFQELAKKLNISNDYFIRTTDKKMHWPGVIEIWKKLEEKRDIYKKKYTGFYCSGCERFVTEKDLVDGRCPNHPTLKIQKISEENYFFKLSKYSSKIKKIIEKDEYKIFPKKWKNDFLGLIKDGLTDVSFSREKKHLPWGIPVPGDENQVMYVWCEALGNYLTGIGYPDKKYEKYWPADVHVVGKDMHRFHAGIWTGMLLSLGLPLPKKLIVHGFLTVGGRKMSKSSGNFIAPLELLKKYPADSIRYTLLRATPFGDDGDFSEQALIDRHNNELANKLGNLVSRVAGLIEKNGVEKNGELKKLPEKWRRLLEEKKVIFHGNITDSKLNNKKLIGGSHLSLIEKYKGGINVREFGFNIGELVESTEIEVKNSFDNYEFDKSLNSIFRLIDYCNWYVQNKKPWETKDKKVLFELKEAILKIADLLLPIIPESAEKIKKQFSATKIKKGEILFGKV